MNYTSIKKDLSSIVDGEIIQDSKALNAYSTDASIFEVTPDLVIKPTNTRDIEAIVNYVRTHKKENPGLSITARSAGTCMSGGSLNSSIILDMTSHLNTMGEIDENGCITVEPGVYYRDFEKKALAKKLFLPSYTASKNLCTIGGMVANNASGEMTLTYGDTAKFVKSVDAVLADGQTYTFEALDKEALEKKMSQENYEGALYRNIVDLVRTHFEDIRAAKPRVSKNSSGYLLWNVWNKDRFNLAQLMCGAQGTLGIITKINLNLLPLRNHHALLVLQLRDLTPLPAVVRSVLTHKPECFESYDEHTFDLAQKYIPESAQKVITDDATIITLIAQFAGDTIEEAIDRANRAQRSLHDHGIESQVVDAPEEQNHYWTIRRSSFQLLRTHSSNKERTAPFIDDIIVPPDVLPKFFPRLQTILSEYHMTYTIAGHIGNGNFHLIPLVDMEAVDAPEKIIELSRRVFALVFEYGGSMAGEHNDGIIRTPFVKDMFGNTMYNVFEKTKQIFDPENIFNPGKKVGGSLDYAKAHMSRHNQNIHL